MPPVKDKKILQYNPGSVEKATKAVKKGMATKTAANTYGVPKTTLHYHVIGKYQLHNPTGAKTVLTSEEESLLVRWVLESASKGFPILKGNFLFSVSQLANELGMTLKGGKPVENALRVS